MLRVVEVGLSLPDLDFLGYGEIYDMFIEKSNDSCEWNRVATQADFDKF